MNASKNKNNLMENTVKELLKKLTTDKLKVGDTFSTEKQLEQELKVSRSIVRESVSQLKALGFLESKQRVGLVVSRPDPLNLLEISLHPFLLNSIELKELAELRYALEIGAVELAVDRANEKQISQLMEYAEEYAKSIYSKNHSKRNDTVNNRNQDDIEKDFHGMILKMTNNTLLERMMTILTTFFSRIEDETKNWENYNQNEKSAWEHRAIAKAFKDRNANRARAILEEHLNFLVKIKQEGGQDVS